MALTYATMGAIVKASEQARNLSRSYCPEKVPSRVTPVNGATVRLEQRSNGLDTALSRLVIAGSSPVCSTLGSRFDSGEPTDKAHTPCRGVWYGAVRVRTGVLEWKPIGLIARLHIRVG